jgi:hypothetical protein
MVVKVPDELKRGYLFKCYWSLEEQQSIDGRRQFVFRTTGVASESVVLTHRFEPNAAGVANALFEILAYEQALQNDQRHRVAAQDASIGFRPDRRLRRTH